MLARFFGLLIVSLFTLHSAQAKTYIRDYNYEASEADSKLSSRAIAMDQVKKLLLQEIGTHIRQKINITKNSRGDQIASEDVEAITAGLTKVEIMAEKWNGVTYYLKAKIEADTDRVLNALEEFKKNNTEENNEQLEKMKANQRELERARAEIDRLKQKLSSATTIEQKQAVMEDYRDSVDALSSSELVDKGYELETSGKLFQALKLYRKAAKMGNALAKNNVGNMYLKGRAVEKDYNKALNLFREASEKGSALAKSNLGYMYLMGYGVNKDHQRAIQLFREAAEEDVALAISNLGYMYLQGYAVRKNYAEAVRLFKKAADKGNKLAQSNLGFMYLNGYEVEKNYYKAVEMFRDSANQGTPLAMNNLGYMYLNGYGVEESIQLAKKWFTKACNNGNQLGCDNLEIDAFK